MFETLRITCQRCGTMLDWTVTFPAEIKVRPCENCGSQETLEAYTEGVKDGKRTAVNLDTTRDGV